MVRAVIIEGNLSFRQELENIFHSRFSSIELIVAENGRNAMEKIETFPPDLSFINMKLPGEDSLKLARKIKSRHPNVIVIIISSYDLPEYREAAYRNGADYFISKDSSVEDYYSLIKSILTDQALHKEGPNRGGKS
jgi:DNA-binding NarL/FixJ family response regulator